MNAEKAGLMTGLLLLAGCATSTTVTQRDTLNEPSDRLAALEDRRPPNPNRPNDTRDLKAPAAIIQGDPAAQSPRPDKREDKGLAVNAGPDQFVRPQDPTQTDEAPGSVGGPARQSETETVSKVDSELAGRVKEAILKLKNPGANSEPQLTSQSTNGEAKVMQNLEVTAKNGRITLSGSADSDAERTAYEEAARHLPGVISVSNYLTVSKTDKQ